MQSVSSDSSVLGALTAPSRKTRGGRCLSAGKAKNEHSFSSSLHNFAAHLRTTEVTQICCFYSLNLRRR